MVISKRERYVFIATVSVLALLALDQFFITPLMARRIELDGQMATLEKQWQRSERLMTDSKRAGRRWTEMSSGGALKKDASETESQLLAKVLDWAKEAGMNVSSVKPDAPQKEKEFQRLTIRATGTGTMKQIVAFLARVQAASVPVRIIDLQITSKKEGTDDLSIQMGISTIYLAGEPEKKDVKPASASAGREMNP